MVKERQRPLTDFQLKKRDRDTEIKLFWQALPQSKRRLADIAKFFHVSIGTVWYAIHGRKTGTLIKKAKHQSDLLARAQQIALDNENGIDTLVER